MGTAYSASSRVWYTVSHGILNEVYFPTIDRPQIRDMEFLISDGETFFQEEKRNLSTKFEYIDSDSPAVRTIGSDPGGRYTLTKDIISNPHHPVVIIHAVLEGDESLLSRLSVYALLAPHLMGGGAGNSARTVEVAGKRSFLAWKDNISLGMICDCGFRKTSCGYVGTSDGWQDLQNLKMDWEFGSALDGNIALTGEVQFEPSGRRTAGVHDRAGIRLWPSPGAERRDGLAGDAVRSAPEALHRAMAPRGEPARTGRQIA